MPPLPYRLFVSIETVGRMATRAGGNLVPSVGAQLLSLEMPGKRAYSVTYAQRALKTTRVLNPENVQRFNQSAKGECAIRAAKEEFEARLRARTPYTDPKQPNLVTAQLLATTFLTDTSVIASWRKTGSLPHVVIDGKVYFDPNDLLAYFVWSL